MTRTFLSALAISSLLSACTGPDTSVGTVSTPAPAPAQPIPADAAASGGTPAAPAVSQRLDAADRAAMARTTQVALEGNQPNEPLRWQGESGSGTITPGAYYETADGRYCRDFAETITVGGQTEQDHGNACRGPGGLWRVVAQ
jgi:surface antigen